MLQIFSKTLNKCGDKIEIHHKIDNKTQFYLHACNFKKKKKYQLKEKAKHLIRQKALFRVV